MLLNIFKHLLTILSTWFIWCIVFVCNLRFKFHWNWVHRRTMIYLNKGCIFNDIYHVVFVMKKKGTILMCHKCFSKNELGRNIRQIIEMGISCWFPNVTYTWWTEYKNSVRKFREKIHSIVKMLLEFWIQFQ